MDPTACYVRIHAALAARDKEEARHAARDLKNWLERGGSYPTNIDAHTVRRTVRRTLHTVRN